MFRKTKTLIIEISLIISHIKKVSWNHFWVFLMLRKWIQIFSLPFFIIHSTFFSSPTFKRILLCFSHFTKYVVVLFDGKIQKMFQNFHLWVHFPAKKQFLKLLKCYFLTSFFTWNWYQFLTRGTILAWPGSDRRYHLDGSGQVGFLKSQPEWQPGLADTKPGW